MIQKCIYTLLKYIADRERAFSLLNLGRYNFPIHITIETVIQVAKNASLQHEKNKFSEKVSIFRINLNTLKSVNKSKHIEKDKQVQTCTLSEENIAALNRDTAGQQSSIFLKKNLNTN